MKIFQNIVAEPRQFWTQICAGCLAKNLQLNLNLGVFLHVDWRLSYDYEPGQNTIDKNERPGIMK